MPTRGTFYDGGLIISSSEQDIRRLLWRRACEFDEIEVNASFVVFSPDNPFDKSWDVVLKLAEIQRRLITYFRWEGS